MGNPLHLIRRVESLKKLQRELAAKRVRARPVSTSQGSLERFIPAVSPRLKAPTFFQPYTNSLEAAHRREGVRAVVAAPPQHGKTETSQHFFPWALLQEPTRRHAYVTYSFERAGDVALNVRHIAAEAGLELDGNRHILRTRQGGSIIFTGIGGPLTGYGIDGLLLVDDPFKSRFEADSKVYRERAHQWLRDVGLTRLHPGASCLIMATRWHPDDLSGRQLTAGWKYLNHSAIAEEDDILGREPGEPLDPERWPLEVLSARRAEVGEYTWASLYQGRPRPRGGSVFGEAHYYESLPREGYRVAYGLDLAYTAKTQADYSVLVELWRSGESFYVVDVIRRQVSAPEFGLTLKAKASARPGVRMRWHASGTEKGSADFLRKAGIPLDVFQAKGDPFVRAQPVAAAWNAGKVLVPDLEFFDGAGRWLDAFLDELQNFTGVSDPNDDQAVALASAFEALSLPVGGYADVRRHRPGLPKPRD